MTLKDLAAVSGLEHAVAPKPRPDTHVAVLGLGYVGLPTSIALSAAGLGVIGVEVSARRLEHIREVKVDLPPHELFQLDAALEDPYFQLTTEPRALRDADAVLICVPTPVHDDKRPDLSYVQAACATVVAQARRGQTIVLTSTTYVGTTRELLIEPLTERGFVIGEDLFVAFAPERIDPGNLTHTQDLVPRVVGGATPACAEAAVLILGNVAPSLTVVASPEAAEFTKLYENTFRAVNIALANEMATACKHYGLDPVEVTAAAASKPYGFLPHWPGAGVGGHCIPCDPHYLIAPLREHGISSPIVTEAMRAIADRPKAVVRRALGILSDAGIDAGDANVLVVGITYKPGVQDVRESPGLEILEDLIRRGVPAEYHDPMVPTVTLHEHLAAMSVRDPDGADYDLVISLIQHPNADYGWMDECARVLDCTYRGSAGALRLVI